MHMKTQNLIFLLLMGLYFNSASAAWNDYLPQPLLRSDLDMMKNISRNELPQKSIGEEISWDNKETGLSGTVKLIRIFKANNHACHEVEHNIHFKSGEIVRFAATLCKDKDDKIEMMPFTFPNK